jgi:hypothetical protein
MGWSKAIEPLQIIAVSRALLQLSEFAISPAGVETPTARKSKVDQTIELPRRHQVTIKVREGGSWAVQ